MLDILPFIAKYFFRILACVYCYMKILDIKMQRGVITISFLFAFISAPLLLFFSQVIPSFSIPATVFIVIVFCYYSSHSFSVKFPSSLCISILSLVVSYILYFFLFLVIAPLLFYLFPEYRNSSLVDVIIVFSCGILLLLSLFCLFRMKRLKKGIPDIEKKISDEICLLTCIPLFALTLLFSSNSSAMFIVLFSSFIISILCTILYLWWRKYIVNNYLHKAQSQTIRILEDTIAKQNEELEKLSKIIHKDNKLIGALHSSVQELYNTTNLPEGLQLKKELESLSQERKGLLHTYETSGKHLLKTNAFSTDVIISYLYKRALEKDIHFDVMISGDVRYMTEHVLEESLLNTLLADLGENAIIATTKSEKRNILLSIGVRNNHYFIDVFDSGAAFDARVIENLGKRRFTTHKEEGGSGIGLMTTFELLKKKKGSFELEEFQQNNLFTKRVSIVFESRFETRILMD